MSMQSAPRRRPLSPHEIRNAPLRQIGFRKGYDPAEVLALLQRVAEEVSARDGQIMNLMAEIDRLHNELYARRYGQLPTNAPNGLNESMINERLQAQRYVDELLATARTSAAQLVAQSRQQAREIIVAAHEAAEQAVREYRAAAASSYTPDREELTRLLTLAQWAIRQLGGLRAQVDATDDAARQELSVILDRLAPILGMRGNPGAGASQMYDDHPPAEDYPRALR